MRKKGRGPSQVFQAAAGNAEPVLVPIDADRAAWFLTQGNIVREINDPCRFYMDTSVTRELEFSAERYARPPHEEALEPGS